MNDYNHTMMSFACVLDGRKQDSLSNINAECRQASGANSGSEACVVDNFQVTVNELHSTINGNDYSSLLEVLSDTYQIMEALCCQFQKDMGINDCIKAFVASIDSMKMEIVELVKNHLRYILDRIHLYDCWQGGVQGNGYRSLLYITQTCLLKIHSALIDVNRNQNRLLFRLTKYQIELDDFSRVLSYLVSMLGVLKQLMSISPDGQLFHDSDEASVKVLQEKIKTLDKECFYGSIFAFQFVDSIANSLKVVNLVMAAYGEAFTRHRNKAIRAVGSLFYGAKYFTNPKLKARQVVDLSSNQHVEFAKSFWQLNEQHIVRHMPSLLCNSVAVNRTLEIKMESIRIQNKHKESILIPFPADSPDAIINIRLLSYHARVGQEVNKLFTFITTLQYQELPPAKGIVIHFHGGGFIAQSSKSHEIYLRSWVKALNVPVVSVDYTLSPEASFPYAIEECFYAYCWILQHITNFGSTADRICLTGDSAGATLAVCVAMRAFEYGLRVPDGIVCSYPAFMFRSAASPSRCLCHSDPLLQQGFLNSCLSAYIGNFPETSLHHSCSVSVIENASMEFSLNNTNYAIIDERTDSFVNNSSSNGINLISRSQRKPKPILSWTDNVLDNPYLSPLLADNSLLIALPSIKINACLLDPILDDSIAFSRRLKNLGVDIQLRVLHGLPHGFLNFVNISDEATAASNTIVGDIKDVLSVKVE